MSVIVLQGETDEGHTGPRVDYLDKLLGYSGEAGLLQALDLQAILNNREGRLGSDGARALAKEVAPLVQMRLVGHGAVVGLVESVALEGLYIASGLENAVGLTEKLGPIRDGANEPAEVNVVQGVILKGPLLRVIVDLTVCV